MTSNPNDICVQRLRPGRSLRVRNVIGCTVMCCAGTVWITQENDARDIFLTAGQRFTFDRTGLALIHAEEGMRNEWMDYMGFAVISLPAKFARPAAAIEPREALNKSEFVIPAKAGIQ